MEVENVALSTTLRDFIRMRVLILELCELLGLDYHKVALIKSTIWEDNPGCQKLANLEMPQMTPRSKDYAIKYHWFRTHIKPNNMSVEKFESKFNIADIFTKGLSGEPFKDLRLLLCGR